MSVCADVCARLQDAGAARSDACSDKPRQRAPATLIFRPSRSLKFSASEHAPNQGERRA